ncbi:MAG: nitrous oxide reductase family maturation protein NosD [Saprospiraceae bacterium]|nr:nitrous oxide reductase family maturation protein NosD [Saprospiraceae bacterium]HMW39910.1 nitrous oxide reductase family maturation protein NosD [Saprospiraceae bacterium]HMX88130.1 nitrous oxide reductase family maturation protein NosD [Saprospiraceae bacterium]HMZ38903.1 nitrous oxide reductase family maturation protein NosD [Saprospiraceae bacterium]HNA64939.1 nitrous oxide reductase family maturation protein NosD [Saprospiraceae bacterium]
MIFRLRFNNSSRIAPGSFFILLDLVFIQFPSIASVITVHPQKENNSIHRALEQSVNGDTIMLSPGIYREGNITIDKGICLMGVPGAILDGEMKYEILSISGQHVVVYGLEFRNSGRSGMNDIAAVRCIDASDIMISHNKILNAHFGIHVSNSRHVRIEQNLVEGIPAEEQNTGNGIHLWKSDTAFIWNNEILGHRDGIYFEFVTSSLIQDNISHDNIRYGLHFMFSHHNTYLCNEFRNNGAGVAVMYSNNVSMEQNLFLHNWGPSAYGLLLKDISDSRISNNSFINNTTGIHFEGTNRIQVFHNIFAGNGWAARVQASCSENIFTKNSFTANTFDVGTNGTMTLNLFKNNYWDKYEGYDIDKNGIGDIPYHPVSLYSMIVENDPNCMILLRSILISFLDKAEKAIPSITPENLSDSAPLMKAPAQ